MAQPPSRARVPGPRVTEQRVAADKSLRLEMTLVDQDGIVRARASEPFKVGSFDLAAARQGMRKLLADLHDAEHAASRRPVPPS